MPLLSALQWVAACTCSGSNSNAQKYQPILLVYKNHLPKSGAIRPRVIQSSGSGQKLFLNMAVTLWNSINRKYSPLLLKINICLGMKTRRPGKHEQTSAPHAQQITRAPTVCDRGPMMSQTAHARHAFLVVFRMLNEFFLYAQKKKQKI